MPAAPRLAETARSHSPVSLRPASLLACYRLTCSPPLIRSRALPARASLALPAHARVAMVGVIDAVAASNRRGTVSALSSLIEACVRQLDQASVAELHELMGELG